MSRPLTDYALRELLSLVANPLPRQSFNSGVARKFEDEGLVDNYDARSPYPSHKPDYRVAWLMLTAKGRELLVEKGLLK